MHGKRLRDTEIQWPCDAWNRRMAISVFNSQKMEVAPILMLVSRTGQNVHNLCRQCPANRPNQPATASKRVRAYQPATWIENLSTALCWLRSSVHVLVGSAAPRRDCGRNRADAVALPQHQKRPVRVAGAFQLRPGNAIAGSGGQVGVNACPAYPVPLRKLYLAGASTGKLSQLLRPLRGQSVCTALVFARLCLGNRYALSLAFTD